MAHRIDFCKRQAARRLCWLVVLVPFAACGRQPAEPAAPARVETAPAIEVKVYDLTGEVRAVDAAGHELQIRHDEIPGFMKAMTMPFKISEDVDMDDFRVGDQLEAKLRVEFEDGITRDYELLNPTVTKPALDSGPSATVDLSGSAPTVTVHPRRLQPGDEVPNFAMTDQDGQTRHLADLRGKVVVLTFVYTRCPLPDYCPAMDRRFSDLAQSLSRSAARSEKVRLVSLSFDPDNDVPEVLKKHARIRGAEPPLWTYAVASHEELAAIAPALGLIYGPGKNEIIHNLCTAIIGPDGKLARLEVGTKNNDWSTADFLQTITPLVGSAEGP